MVQSHIARKKIRHSAFLPPYAPELNSTENVWNYLKMNSMANEALFDLDSLTEAGVVMANRSNGGNASFVTL
jgi:hypothetical protein